MEAGLLPMLMAVAPAQAVSFSAFHKDMQQAAPKWHAELHATALCPHADLPALAQALAAMRGEYLVRLQTLFLLRVRRCLNGALTAPRLNSA